jgi:hypothetical protein
MHRFPKNDLEEIIVVLVGRSTVDGLCDDDGSPNPIDLSYDTPISASGFICETAASPSGWAVESRGYYFDAETGFLLSDLEAAGKECLIGSGSLRLVRWRSMPDPADTDELTRLRAQNAALVEALLEAKSELRDWHIDHPVIKQIHAALAQAGSDQ